MGIVWMFVLPYPNSYVEILDPKVIELWGTAFQGWSGPEGRVLMNGLASL